MMVRIASNKPAIEPKKTAMTTKKPSASKPFPDKITILLQLAAQELQPGYQQEGKKADDVLSGAIHRFRQRAIKMQLKPILETGRQWRFRISAGLNNASVTYGICRRPSAVGNVLVSIEFNPQKVGAAGLKTIENDIPELLGTPLPFSAILSKAKVRQLHVTTDVTGRRLPDLLIVGRNIHGSVVHGAKAKGHTSAITTMGNGIETVNFYNGGKQAQLLFTAYDKMAEQEHQECTLYQHGLQVSRLEHKMKPRNLWLAELDQLSNPLSQTGIVDLLLKQALPVPTMIKFADSVRARGLAESLTRHRGVSKEAWEHMISQDAPWWDPKAMWLDWANSLAECGLDKWIKWSKNAQASQPIGGKLLSMNLATH